jgi:hypothetical protein
VQAFRSYDDKELFTALRAIEVVSSDALMLHSAFSRSHGFPGSIEQGSTCSLTGGAGRHDPSHCIGRSRQRLCALSARWPWCTAPSSSTTTKLLERVGALAQGVLDDGVRAIGYGLSSRPGVELDLSRFDFGTVRLLTNDAAALPTAHIRGPKGAFPRARLVMMQG